MWAYDTTFYQIYTLGLCGAPKQNDGIVKPRVSRISGWIPHLQKLKAGAVYFCPVFSSDSHGYDTRDYRMLDERLGTNADFAALCGQLHEAGIRVVLDGVFNHVGRGFWAFRDVLEKRESSRYKNWFHIDFGGDSPYNDGLRYEGWEGHYELVKLNLHNGDVVDYLLESVALWIKEFGIDGLRLDVAYSLPEDFMRRLRVFCEGRKHDFFLLGEVLHGDYNRLMGSDKLHSVTNYQAYKGMWSSFNDLNMFEINYTLEQHFNRMYIGSHLLSFVDNHDVDRVASVLKNPKHLPLIYALLFGMPGIPCVYYGSEWGVCGKKGQGSDDALRPAFELPESGALTDYIAKLSSIRAEEPALRYGSYRKLLLTNRQLVFERALPDQSVVVAINADSVEFDARFKMPEGEGSDLLNGGAASLSGRALLPPFSVHFWRFPPRIGDVHVPALTFEEPQAAPDVPGAERTEGAAANTEEGSQSKTLSLPDTPELSNRIYISGRAMIFESVSGGRRILAAINAGDEPVKAVLGIHAELKDLLSGESCKLEGEYTLPARKAYYWEM